MSTSVFFFGGSNATQTHVDAWVKSAKAQKAAIDFNGFPWPNYGDGSTDDAITTFKKSDEYKSMVATIEASSAGPIYIVGHSSGCAIANSVDTDLKEKDTKKLCSWRSTVSNPAPSNAIGRARKSGELISAT